MSTRDAISVFEKNSGPISFATFILGVRTTLDLNQLEMAQKLGLSKSALCELEKGRTLVSTQTAVKYAKKAGFSVTLALEACLQDQLNKANVKKRVYIKDVA